MKIENIKVKNYKGIEEADISPNGKHVYLIGKNGSGKTSFIETVFKGLSGKDLPSEPISKGKKTSELRIDLGEFVAVTTFTRGKPNKFVLENKNFDNKKDQFIASPRAYINSLIGILDFDINDFFAKTDAEQVKYFCKLSSIDFSDLDADIQEIEDSRLFDKKSLVIAKSKIVHYDKKLLEKDEVSVTERSKEISAAKDKIKLVKTVEEGIKTRKDRIGNIDLQIAALLKERNGVVMEGNEVVEKGLIHQVNDGEAWLKLPENKVLTDDELKTLEDSFDKLEEENKYIKEAKEGKEVDLQVEKLETAIEKANEDIKSKKEEKSKRISKNITIEGLVYDLEQERFLYNGLPFEKEQINTASQLIAGLKIGAMLLKDLKILKVDASLIDKVEFDKVLAWADENGIELFVELVDREGGELQIVIDEE